MLQRLTLLLLALALCAPCRAAGGGPGPVVERTLPNGMRIVCRQETATPLVAMDVFVKAGTAQEAPGQAGLSSLVARTLLASTASHVPETLAQQIGALGGNVGVTWQPDWTQINSLFVADQFDNAAFLLADVLKDADFDPGVVEEARRNLLSEIDQGDASPFGTAYAGVRRVLYAGTGLAGPSQGTVGSVRRLTRSDLLRFFDRCYVPQNFVFVVVGNIDPETAIRKITEDMDDFPTQGRGGRRADAAVPAPPPPPAADSAPVRTYEPDLAEVLVMAGYPAPAIAAGDYPVMLVANAILGGMKSSRLFTNVREVKGLSYDLGSAYTPQVYSGDIDGYVFAPPTWTDPQTKKTGATVGLIKQLLLAQFDSLRTTPPTPAELARAQHFLVGAYKIRHERLEDRASLLGLAVLARPQGWRWDTDYAAFIGAVTAADVQRVAQKYFVHPVISTIEPSKPGDGVVRG